MRINTDPRPAPKPIPIPPSRQRHANLFRTYSGKEKRLAMFESELELRVWMFHEGQPSVARLCEQPIKIEVFINGKKVTTILDLWVRWRTKQKEWEEWVEVKPYDKLLPMADGELKPNKWDAVEIYEQENFITCKFITDRDMAPHKQFIDNWIQIMPYVQRGHQEDDLELKDKIYFFVKKHSPINLRMIERKFEDYETGSIHAAVFVLIHGGQLTTDLATHPINRTIQIEVAHG